MRSVKRGRSSLFPSFFGRIANKVARMDHAYLPVGFSEIDEDRIFVKRQIVFPSEGFADCLRSQQESRFCRYGTIVSGMLMISMRHLLMSSSVKTSPRMMRSRRKVSSYSRDRFRRWSSFVASSNSFFSRSAFSSNVATFIVFFV